MNGATVAILAISSLSLITSAATLTLVLVGAKRMQEEVEEVRETANGTVKKIKNALNDLEF